ncbi:response regulator [Candidatus Magnetaquicoccus inordinatus]|uniref:response regulator n=1 Tax=Candidatus Magnetaquicoccus inordinatus TaxID=2496818 RepID=UPI00102AA9AC|nr:response regulator [Candidatus Magnetaquicoccus inordinatus]
MDQPLCILIIDDNPVERALLSGLLKKIRHWTISCVQCASGHDALGLLCTTMPHIIFIDYRLDGETGIDVIHRLRAAGCHAGFILFTGTIGEEAMLEALRAGADDYLHKTDLNLESVSRAIHYSLEKRRNAEALTEAMQALRTAHDELENRVRARTAQLQETQEKLDIITSAAHDPIILLDQEGRVIFWNPAATHTFGYTPEEMLGKEVFSLLPPSDFKKRILASFQSFRQTGQGTMVGHVSEFTVRRKNGDTFPVSASISPIRRPEGWHTVVIARDVTKKQQTELALRRAKEEAEQATRLKDQFVSLVAHDLRGPFTTIMGFLELMDSDKKDPLSKRQKGFIRWMVDSCQKMLQMIDELLNIGRLKTGKITPKPRFLNAHFLVETIIEQFTPTAAQKTIRLENGVSTQCRLYVDPDLFGEVLRNLFSNAIKFCRPGGWVRISSLEGTPVTLAVKDNGVGISKKRQGKIFCLEEKSSTIGTAGEHGTGFGLPFSLELMKAHGGTLTVESKEEEGSTFYAYLPEVTPQILVVDDDPDFRQLLRLRLSMERTNVVETDSGLTALHLVAAQTFHLIIADVQMPGMNGFELLRELRNKPESREIPIILVTGDDSITTREKAFQLGANDFITKPFDYANFLPRVRRFLG